MLCSSTISNLVDSKEFANGSARKACSVANKQLISFEERFLACPYIESILRVKKSSSSFLRLSSEIPNIPARLLVERRVFE